MSVLEIYVKAVKESKGITRQVRLRNLRRYLKEAPAHEVNTNIYKIMDISLLKILWEAGLTNEQQQHVERQTLQLKERRQR